MEVGVNYPWHDYGWDFGSSLPGWRNNQSDPNWYADIEQDLRHLRQIGITVVRMGRFCVADTTLVDRRPHARMAWNER